MSGIISKEEFLDKKRDFSPLLVHLTRDDDPLSAKDVLHKILDEKILKAFNHYCLFSTNLKQSNDNSLQDKFKVVCFTETPIDQIGILLSKIKGRKIQLDPYGLVFKKEYIKNRGGNPVFYSTKKIAKPLWSLYWDKPSEEVCKLLSLVNVYDETVDFHWEREWRVQGNLQFTLSDIYCGLCPEEDIPEFENIYKVIFISPTWGINRILDKLVGNKP